MLGVCVKIGIYFVSASALIVSLVFFWAPLVMEALIRLQLHLHKKQCVKIIHLYTSVMYVLV